MVIGKDTNRSTQISGFGKERNPFTLVWRFRLNCCRVVEIGLELLSSTSNFAFRAALIIRTSRASFCATTWNILFLGFYGSFPGDLRILTHCFENGVFGWQPISWNPPPWTMDMNSLGGIYHFTVWDSHFVVNIKLTYLYISIHINNDSYIRLYQYWLLQVYLWVKLRSASRPRWSCSRTLLRRMCTSGTTKIVKLESKTWTLRSGRNPEISRTSRKTNQKTESDVCFLILLLIYYVKEDDVFLIWIWMMFSVQDEDRKWIQECFYECRGTNLQQDFRHIHRFTDFSAWKKVSGKWGAAWDSLPGSTPPGVRSFGFGLCFGEGSQGRMDDVMSFGSWGKGSKMTQIWTVGKLEDKLK